MLVCHFSRQILNPQIIYMTKYKVPPEEIQGLANLLRHLMYDIVMKLQRPDNGSPENALLQVYDGFTCRHCEFRPSSLRLINRKLLAGLVSLLYASVYCEYEDDWP